MVLVVAIMMSVCLVQAFAASSKTVTIGGYSATAYVSRNSSFRAFGETTYDVSAIVEMSLGGYYAMADGSQVSIEGEGGANHYQVTVYGTPRPSAAYVICNVQGYGSVYGEDIGEVSRYYDDRN